MNAKPKQADAAVPSSSAPASPASANEPVAEVAQLQAQLEAAHAQIAAKDEAYRRALADSQNIQRRAQEERRQVLQSAAEALLTDLLPTLDHLEMAVQHFPDDSLRMIVNEYRRVLESHGLQRMQVIGKPFDPHTMEAVETGDGPQDQVLQEQRAGYLLGSRVLRHAQVVVGR